MFNQGIFRTAVLAITDCLLLYGVWFAVVYGYYWVGLGHYEPEFYLRMWPVGPVFIFINYIFRLYHGRFFHPAAPLSPVEELRRLVGSSLITHFGIITVLAFARQTTEDYSRVVIAASGFLVALMSQPFRNLVRKCMFALGGGRIPVFFAGSGAAADIIATEFETNVYIGFRVVRRFNDSQLREIVPAAQKMGVNVLVVCQDVRLFQCRMAEYAKWFTHVEYLPTTRAFPVLGARAISFGGFGGLEMVNQGRIGVLRLEKWLLDKVLAVLAFIAFLPFFLIIPVLIKLTSRGPVFYRQKRLGRQGVPIRVWKFRSMYDDADDRLKRILASDPKKKDEWEKNFKLFGDPRVTPLGRFLRRTSLDELPQLFNVFAGEMALIGPRPIVWKEVTYYGEDYKVFYRVKPGITGLWQVSGRSETDYARRVALDTYYVLNWSPWLDIWILMRTVGAVLSMRGAC